MTILQVLKPSRKKLLEGDIFALRILDGPYMFGRVIRVAENGGPMRVGFLLIYIYKATSDDKHVIPVLCREDLLIPPQPVNRLPWSRGYFEVVAHCPLTENDVLPVHCFKRYRKGFVDEYGDPLPDRVEPCGIYGLSSYRTIDDDICRALGIPLAPD